MKLFSALCALGFLVVFGQQCSQVELGVAQAPLRLQLSETPYRLNAPSSYTVQKRFVFLVDMSNSMISSPCPQDVDANLLFQSTPQLVPYDPNKGAGLISDHRGSAVDCKVNNALPYLQSAMLMLTPQLLSSPPRFYETPRGIDPEGDRLKTIKNWLNRAMTEYTPRLQANTKVLIYPITGGARQEELLQRFPLSTKDFYDLNDHRLLQALLFLEEEQLTNQTLVSSDDMFRYKKTTMGTTSLGPALGEVFTGVKNEVDSLLKRGVLSETEMEIVYMTDGQIGPKQEDFQRVMDTYGVCGACSNPQNCPPVCSDLLQRMERAWGQPQLNTLEQVDFQLGMIQSLPAYYGAGMLRSHFVQVREERMKATRPNLTSSLPDIADKAKARGRKVHLWKLEDGLKEPFDLLGSSKGIQSFQVSEIFVLNPNVRLDSQLELRVDSDGDGLFDHEELALGFDPLNPRTNGICLDSFSASETFKERCESLVQSRSCDNLLDTDGDGLNECEESLLGTNPFDFDTDGDAIPDSLEWIYGYNPTSSDSRLDSNKDGLPNIHNFNKGLPALILPKDVDTAKQLTYGFNYMGKEILHDDLLGSVGVELYKLILHNVPIRPVLPIPSENVPVMNQARQKYLSSVESYSIPEELQLISGPTLPNHNRLLVLARLRNQSADNRTYWRMLKVDVANHHYLTENIVDLSKAKQLRAMDYNE